MTLSSYDYCIVGAGPAGLTLAYKLLEGGKSVQIVERDTRAGGLSKSYDIDGHIFDTGPKRFHTDDPIVQNFISSIAEMDEIGRSTMVFFLSKYFTWPLKASELYKLPISTGIKSFIDMLKTKQIEDRFSFEQFIKYQYGDTLYGIFFKPYTEKFLRWKAEDIHSDWASTGINRTVIDKRVKANSLFDLLRSIALPQKIDTRFLYPKQGGFGAFFDNLLGACMKFEKFSIILDDTISGLEDSSGHFNAVTTKGKTLRFENLVWSGNLNDLRDLTVPQSKRELIYLNTLFYNFICKESGVSKNRAQWIYVSSGDSLVSRITCMREFNQSTTPDGYYNFICELTDSQTDPKYFANPEAHKDDMIKELVGMDFLTGTSGIEAVHINPVVDTYPIYHRRYHKDFGRITKEIRQFSKRVHLLGRTGAFWYNNSDHSIRMALDMAQKILKDPEIDFDFRGYFGGAFREDSEPETNEQ